jgi:hypothetical protein
MVMLTKEAKASTEIAYLKPDNVLLGITIPFVLVIFIINLPNAKEP